MNAKSTCLAALIFVVVFQSRLEGGTFVSLVPSHPGPYDINDPSTLNFTVDVMLRLDENSPTSSFFVSMRFDTADSTVQLQGAVTHPQSDLGLPIHFWDLSATETCQQYPSACGAYYTLDSDFDDNHVQLFLNQLILPTRADRFELFQSTDTRIGVAAITLPALPGTYILDMLNSNEIDTDHGARLTIGLGIPTMPWITYTAQEGTIAGGRYIFTVIPEPNIVLLFFVGAAWLFLRHSAISR